MSDVSDADSDDIAGLLGDVDAVDSDLFGKKSAQPAKKVSFGQSMAKPASTARTKSTLDELLGSDSFAKPTSPAAPPPPRAKRDESKSSGMDDLFGPTSRKPAAAADGRAKKAATSSWLGLGGGGADSSSDEDGGFKDMLDKRKKPAEPRRQTAPDEPPPSTVKETPPSRPVADDRPISAKPATGSGDVPQPKARPPPPWERVDEPPVKAAPISRVPEKPSSRDEPPRQAASGISDATLANLNDIIARLQMEKEELKSDLSAQKQSFAAEKAETVREWKEKVVTVQAEFSEELQRLRESHRTAIGELQSVHDGTVDRVKTSMQRELEAAASAYEHTRSFHDMVTKIDSSADQLATLGNRVADLHESSHAERAAQLAAREERTKRVESRLEQDLAALNVDRERVQTILLKLETNLKEQEKLLEADNWRLREDRSKLDAEKSSFAEERRKFEEGRQSQTAQGVSGKESFVMEQQGLLERVLYEQERLQEERTRFDVQRDRDVARLRQEALRLDERLRQADAATDAAERSRGDFEARQRRLIELEEALAEQAVDLDRARLEVERERQQNAVDRDAVDQRQKQLDALNKTVGERASTRPKVDMTEILRHNDDLQTTLLETQRALHRETAAALEQRSAPQLCVSCGGAATTQPADAYQAERPYDNEVSHFVRSGSIRTVLRKHTKELENFITNEDKFMDRVFQ